MFDRRVVGTAHHGLARSVQTQAYGMPGHRPPMLLVAGSLPFHSTASEKTKQKLHLADKMRAGPHTVSWVLASAPCPILIAMVSIQSTGEVDDIRTSGLRVALIQVIHGLG